MRIPAILPLIALVLTGCGASTVRYETSEQVQDDDRPGLRVGQAAPAATVLDIDGSERSLSSIFAENVTVLVFYRGGWCQFCNQTLADWAARSDELEALGAQVVALSPESPDHSVETGADLEGPVLIFSDANHEAARAFEVSKSLGFFDRSAYSLGGIDLGDWNASGSWELPAGATFVIDAEGEIRYAFADWDHTVRADPAEVLRVIRDLERSR